MIKKKSENDIWTTWTSVRKIREGATTNDLFAFLTTEPNAIAAPIHAKAMPVILSTPDEIETWMTASDDALRIVARGLKEDAPAIAML